MLVTIIIFILVLSVIVFVHEIGHFYTARKLGVKVEEFGLGLPPRIFGIYKINGRFQFVWWRKALEKDSPTVYSLNIFPIGGFVKIKGEGGEEAASPDSFANKAVWKRSVMIAAGVIMNVILCMVLLAVGFGFGMPSALGDKLDSRAVISNKNIQIIEVVPDSRAQEAGLRAGDSIVSIGGQKFSDIRELNSYLSSNENQELSVIISRGQKEITKPIKVEKYYFEDREIIGFGISLIETAIVRYPWYLAISKGVIATFIWLAAIVIAFATVIKNLLVGVPVGVEVAGPVGIAVLTGQAVNLGWIYLLQFTALLSLNLAIINILPFPALDGGRLLFLAIEKIRGRAVKQEWENLIHNIGFILLMVLILFVTFGDVAKYGGRILGAVKGLVGL